MVCKGGPRAKSSLPPNCLELTVVTAFAWTRLVTWRWLGIPIKNEYWFMAVLALTPLPTDGTGYDALPVEGVDSDVQRRPRAVIGVLPTRRAGGCQSQCATTTSGLSRRNPL